MKKKQILAKLMLVLALLTVMSLPSAAQTRVGPSGLKLPRFVSLKSDRVNVRAGPSTDHKVLWIFRRAGLPVEIIEESDNWRKIRDSEGEMGWVYHSLLSGRRTALISPWQRAGTIVPLLREPRENTPTTAKAQIGVQVDVNECANEWCDVGVQGYEGWIKSNLLWGVYPKEDIE